MKAYLVIDANNDSLKPYSERFKVILNREEAIECAEDMGMEDDFGMGYSDKIGRATHYRCGEVDVIFLPTEINESSIDERNLMFRKDGTPVAIRG